MNEKNPLALQAADLELLKNIKNLSEDSQKLLRGIVIGLNLK